MYARTVTVELKSELFDEVLAFGRSVQTRFEGLPGLVFWSFSANRETGRGTSYSVFETEEAFLSLKADIDQILSALGAYLASPPTEILAEVLLSVDNRSPEE